MRSSSSFWVCASRRSTSAIRARASLSSKSAACADDAAMNTATTTNRAIDTSSLASVNHVVPAILGPRDLVVALIARLFLAEAHRFDLDLGNAQHHHHPLDGIRALLRERPVEFL